MTKKLRKKRKKMYGRIIYDLLDRYIIHPIFNFGLLRKKCVQITSYCCIETYKCWLIGLALNLIKWNDLIIEKWHYLGKHIEGWNYTLNFHNKKSVCDCWRREVCQAWLKYDIWWDNLSYRIIDQTFIVFHVALWKKCTYYLVCLARI